MNYTKRGSFAGTQGIDGGMNTSIAGMRNAIGMIAITTETEIVTVTTTTTTTTTESSSF
jgi:hypothetical protein